jgi:hypothetical protein
MFYSTNLNKISLDIYFTTVERKRPEGEVIEVIERNKRTL